MLPVAVLGAIGYTVSLLIARLALGEESEQAAAAVLTAPAIASLAAVVLLRRRSRGDV